MRNTHLKQDKNALYQDIFVDGLPFQVSLKKSYPLEFSRGRYGEEFMPRLMSKRNNINHSFDSQNMKMIAPIYGCQNNCCMYFIYDILVSLIDINSVKNWNNPLFMSSIKS